MFNNSQFPILYKTCLFINIIDSIVDSLENLLTTCLVVLKGALGYIMIYLHE